MSGFKSTVWPILGDVWFGHFDGESYVKGVSDTPWSAGIFVILEFAARGPIIAPAGPIWGTCVCVYFDAEAVS